MEIQLEEYATKTTEDISNYFLFLHGVLQNEEKKIADRFKKSCDEPQQMLKNTFRKLAESQEVLKIMRTNLEEYHEKPPYDVNLRHVVYICNKQLEKIPCRLQVTKIQDNPFRFNIKKSTFEDLQQYYNYSYADPKISIKLGVFREDTNSILKSSMLFDKSAIAQYSQKDCTTSKKKNKNRKRNIMIKSSNSNSLSDSTDSLREDSGSGTSIIDEVKIAPFVAGNSMEHHIYVRLTHVQSPDHFYVQNINESQKIRELSHAYLNYVFTENVPKTIKEGYLYMAYNQKDKQWYRGILKKIFPNDVYKLFLVDYGMHLNVPKESAPARLIIIERISDRNCVVDLHNEQTKSVRESFLYTGLARDRPGFLSFKMQIKTISPDVKEENGLAVTHYFRAGEILRVTVTHIEGPQEFYVVKSDLTHDQHQFQNDLNEHYASETIKPQQLYLGSVQMYCVVCLEEFWHRAVIEEIKENDKGTRHLINWRQAYVLEERFRKVQEYCLRCALADIEPLQENDYTYPATAIKDFKQMATNPNLRIEICSVRDYDYKVALFVSKKKVDINVGVSLVKNKYGISTGETTQEAEITRVSKSQFVPFELMNKVGSLGATSLLNTDMKASSRDGSSKKVVKKILKRTPVIITHVVNPGEFYLRLASLSEGTKTFHRQIQETQNHKYKLRTQPELLKNWSLGDACMVYTKCQHTFDANNLHENFNLSLNLSDYSEWYRGVVTDIVNDLAPKPTYTIFLRDVGTTVRSIPAGQLFPIDSLLNRVSNAVYRCQLSCVQPTGGKSWSLTSTDCFKHYITKFESLGVTLQSKCSLDKKSLPIVLWGIITETTDPLAPCITKYSNINYSLVKSGVAHLVEQLDTTQEFSQLEEIESAEDEITLEQWLKSFANNATLTAIERIADNHMRNTCDGFLCDNASEQYASCNEFSFEYDELSDILTTGQTAPPPAWLECRRIEKTLFTGFPTYIDYDCIVYIHDSEGHGILERMCLKLGSKYGQLPPPSSDYKYAIGQPIVAAYTEKDLHKLYRCVVEGLPNDCGEWSVRYIDYGNVETVVFDSMRPYAPYPNLKAIANQFRIEGIKPKFGAEKFSTLALDFIHLNTVARWVTVRVSEDELHKPIRLCKIRHGAIDIAHYSIEEGHADSDHSRSRIALNLMKPNRQRNPILFEQNGNNEFMHSSMDSRMDVTDKVDTSSDNDDMNEGNTEDEYEGLDELIERLDNKRKPAFDQFSALTSSQAINQQDSLVSLHLPKRRMFDENEYAQLLNEVKDSELNVDFVDDAFCEDDEEENKNDLENAIDDDNDEDVVFLDHGSENDYYYWQPTKQQDLCEQEQEYVYEKDSFSHIEQDAESEFEQFNPNATSTAASHFSGTEFFKQPQLPQSMKTFTCCVVSILKPALFQVFPLHLEFEYREMDMQRTIERIARVAPPLTKFKPRTVCLARYTKDKRWYRAVIFKYSTDSKLVEVLYVDYLNSETLPVTEVRQCPKELLILPLRTFRVRLHDVKPNPMKPEGAIRSALHKLLSRRKIHAVIKKRSMPPPASKALVFGTTQEDFVAIDSVLPSQSDVMEVTLYESAEVALKGVTIYESLIQDDLFIRI
uniref:Tudor domain-containing protein n=1 Tax=Glossina pallidipes TaxID=7398 RepID=A0A1A9ZEA0_GLOPL